MCLGQLAVARPLLVCLDLQRAFIAEGPLQAIHGAETLLSCAQVLAHARRERWTIAHCFVQREHGDIYIPKRDALPIPGFEPRVSERVIERATLSAYGASSFAAIMDEAPMQCAVVVGLSASVTFLATAFDAFEHGHKLVPAPRGLAAQAGMEASAAQHASVARDLATRLGFPTADAGGAGASTLLQLGRMT